MDKRIIYARDALLQVAARYVQKGWNTFFPLTEDIPIDLVIYKKGCFKRVQVKSVCMRREAIKIKLRSTNNWSNKKYTSKEIDTIAVFERKEKTCYEIDIQEIEGMSEVTLRKSPLKGIICRQAKNYLL